jgi:hypothetical protein
MAAARMALRLPPKALSRFQLPRRLLQSSSSPIAIQWALHHSKAGSCLAISLRVQCLDQHRFQSTTSKPGNGNAKRPGHKGTNPPPKIEPFGRLMGRALYASLRSLGAPFRIETMKKLYRQNPIELVIALGMYVTCQTRIRYAVQC